MAQNVDDHDQPLIGMCTTIVAERGKGYMSSSHGNCAPIIFVDEVVLAVNGSELIP